jgi:anti-anti-sigma factor
MNCSIQIVESPSRLTEATKDEFYQSVQLKAKTTAGWIVVNLSNVDFIDSQGLGVLFAAHKVAALCHKELVLLAPQPSIYRELSVTGITKLIKIYDSFTKVIQDVASYSRPHFGDCEQKFPEFSKML